MKKMLKRADGSTSQRGLWDNIRAKAASNKKAGKKGKSPSKAMLEQENKIKAEERKMGGNWMQDSKELKFGGVSKKYQTAGTKFTVTGLSSNASPSKQCVGANCKDVIAGGSSYAGGSGTNYTGPGGAQLSMKPKYGDRLANQTVEEQMAGLENQAKYKAEAEARMAKKKAERDARAAASAPAEVQYDYKKVYAIDPNAPFDPNAKQKTGGKRKYIKK